MKPLSLTRFELYKLLSRKSIWVLLAIMVIAIYLPMQLLGASSSHPPIYQPTPPTAQQIQRANVDVPQFESKLQTVKPGSQQYWKLFNQIQHDEAIKGSSDGSVFTATIQGLQNRISDLKAKSETRFTYRMNKMEYDMLKSLPFVGGGAYGGSGAQMADFFKTYGFVMYGAMILIGLSSIFSEEYSIGTDSFLLTAKRGRHELVTAKLLASVLYCVAMEGVLFIVNVVLNLILYGVKGLGYPIQSIPLYGAPFHLSVLQYILVALVVQALAGIAFGFLVLLFSSFNRVSLVTFFISAGILILPELISKMTRENWAQAVMNFSYTGLIQVSRLFQSFVAYNFFGYPVLYPILSIVLVILISIPIVWLTYSVYCRHQIS
ncbi:ABC transporter permease [Alicyclobacillus tolerans]|uniref:ABC transporter permease n=1 Tax=Alicyclobacillus tolerans TaxID=90970 RepID=UPI001F19B3F0|nr:ABC transporter permease subunit [Alicyclobacillus tolerans]MCF8564578.1 ABC transporter permease [Alicyclobacillus tolerans]